MGQDLIRRDAFLPVGFTADAVSLRVSDVTEEEFFRGCQTLSRLQNVANESLPYWIGDLLCAAESRFPNRYEQAMELTDYSIGSLRNYKWMCSKVPPENRGIMSIPHTQAVAAQPIDKQREYLLVAKNESLTPKELRRYIAGDPHYKKPIIPADGSTKRDKMNACFETVWKRNSFEWQSIPPKELARKVWDLCVMLALDA